MSPVKPYRGGLLSLLSKTALLDGGSNFLDDMRVPGQTEHGITLRMIWEMNWKACEDGKVLAVSQDPEDRLMKRRPRDHPVSVYLSMLEHQEVVCAMVQCVGCIRRARRMHPQGNDIIDRVSRPHLPSTLRSIVLDRFSILSTFEADRAALGRRYLDTWECTLILNKTV